MKMVLTLKQRIQLVQLYYANNKSITATIRLYRLQYGIQNICSRQGLTNLIHKFEKTGSVKDADRSGRPSVSKETLAEVYEATTRIQELDAQGTSSTRIIARDLNLSKSTIWNVLRTKLKHHPYKISRVQEITKDDTHLRYVFALRAIVIMETEENWLYNILWTDEAHFSISGHVNTKNCVVWADQNPHRLHSRPLFSPRITVWCGFTSNFILGPYFFEEQRANGTVHTVTVTGARYLDLLQTFIIPQLQQLQVLQETTFQHDGAPPHNTIAVRRFLAEHFGNRIISRNFDFPWPARSPDLNPCDFWLWGFLKSKVYAPAPATLNELKERITDCIAHINIDILRNVVGNFADRVILCEARGGSHFENYM
jgi:transposase